MKEKIITLFLCVSMVLYIPITARAGSLKERITALEERISALEALVGVESIDKIETESITEIEPETEEAVETEEVVLMDTQEFLDDILASYKARRITSGKYTSDELNSMSNDETVAYNSESAESERELYNKYMNAKFEDLNIQYLCKQYIDGLSKQYEVCEKWESNGDIDSFFYSYESGYDKCAYVIVELSYYYDLPFINVSDMQLDTLYMDYFLKEAKTRNAAVDRETVKKTQELLNGIGFICGNEDRVLEERTAKSIKRFQEMYGYDPVDGIIDDELIKQLEDELAKK